MRGELHRSEDVRRVMNDMLGAFRARVLAIPSKTAPRLLAQTDLAVVQDIIKKKYMRHYKSYPSMIRTFLCAEQG